MKPKFNYRLQNNNYVKKQNSDKSDSSYSNLPTSSPILVKTESDFLGKQDSLNLNHLNANEVNMPLNF